MPEVLLNVQPVFVFSAVVLLKMHFFATVRPSWKAPLVEALVEAFWIRFCRVVMRAAVEPFTAGHQLSGSVVAAGAQQVTRTVHFSWMLTGRVGGEEGGRHVEPLGRELREAVQEAS